MEREHSRKESPPYTACWALWPDPRRHALPLPRIIDQALARYLFYPEPEWARYGYRPPETYPLLGAWRSPSASVFAFLLGPDPVLAESKEKNLLLYVAGERAAVDELGATVTALKSGLAKSDRKELQVRQTGYRLGLEQKSPSISRLAKLIGLSTVVINALSLYLRKLSPPDLPSATAASAYHLLIGAVHFSALLLLLITTLTAIGYAIRYSLLVLRRF